MGIWPDPRHLEQILDTCSRCRGIPRRAVLGVEVCRQTGPRGLAGQAQELRGIHAVGLAGWEALGGESPDNNAIWLYSQDGLGPWATGGTGWGGPIWSTCLSGSCQITFSWDVDSPYILLRTGPQEDPGSDPQVLLGGLRGGPIWSTHLSGPVRITFSWDVDSPYILVGQDLRYIPDLTSRCSHGISQDDPFGAPV